MAACLARSDVWCLVAEREGAVVAHVATLPANAARRYVDDPLLAHLWQLFVRPALHGSGLATELLRHAEHESWRRGFRSVRLFTPVGQARARRFYEREGFTVRGEPFLSDFGLALVEYRRDLERPTPPPPPLSAPRRSASTR
ncbi:MAG: GNAT family N-acetyltransferase [Solirubrobacterales bacterium]|nr:GNAT family N-acetyltransferase [Solirubrobacterales bacterium]